MPAIPIHPLDESRSSGTEQSNLPRILKTPSGLAMVEIQGTLKFSETMSSPSDGSKAEPLHIGKLVFPYYDESASVDDTSWHKRVHLYVGKHQRLTGEVKKLSNPVAVLQRKPDTNNADELEIAEIIRYKLLFANRPEPVGGSNE